MRMTLFLTKSLTLHTWYEQGILERELAVYRSLQSLGVDITIVSYGGREEHEFAEQLQGMRLLTNWINWHDRRYEHRLHQLHGLHFWKTDVLKTNQMIGAEVAVRASRFWKTPLLLRMGYLWSYNAQQAHPDKPQYLKQVNQIETEAIEHASHIVVTTDDIRQRILERQPEVEPKITRIPNYVDTATFRPMEKEKVYDLVYVGRIAKEKNLQALLQAVDRAGVTIAMIGDGDVRESLQTEFQHMGKRVQWLGRIPNTQLPQYINRARIYILSSFYEGHPKALIEAMACGVPVIGTNIYGIQQVVQHEHNGYLSKTDTESLQHAIETLLDNPPLMQLLGENARRFVVEQYALDKIAQKEFDLLRQLSDN